MNNDDILKIPFGGKIITLKLSTFEELELDTDSLLRIDYSNLLGEQLTISAAINKVGLLRAQAEEIVNKLKFRCEIFHSELASEARKYRPKKDSEEAKTFKAPTIAEVDAVVISNEDYQKRKYEHINAIKNYESLDSVYQAYKDKSRKLDSILNKLVPTDHEKELVEGVVNGILVKSNKKLIPDAPIRVG